jgi:rhodanese-related sulfurtransferase
VGAVAAGAPLVDVRRQDEWDAGHAEGAQLLPLARIEAGELPKLDKAKPVFVYCASGRRAGTAVKIMREAGFTDVTNIGGFTDWKRAGGPVASS